MAQGSAGADSAVCACGTRFVNGVIGSGNCMLTIIGCILALPMISVDMCAMKCWCLGTSADACVYLCGCSKIA